MTKNILFCLAVFAAGLGIGTLNTTIVEVEVEKPVIKKVYNLTGCPSLKDMQIYASFHNKALIDKDEAERSRHRTWQQGFQSGLLEGFKKE